LKEKISKEKLYFFYVEENKTDSQIGEMYGLSTFSVWNLRKKYNIKGINARHRKYFDNPQIEITERQMSIIRGSLLGDACLKGKGAKTSYLSISHTYKQKEYIEWLYGELKSICPSEPCNYVSKGKYVTMTLNSESREDLFDIRSKIYTPTKRVGNWFIDGLNNIVLAIWYMDDGSLQYINASKSIFSFATNSFTQEDNYMLSKALYEKFGLYSEVKPHNKKSGVQYNLLISKQSFDRFINIVSPHIVPSMKYKLPCDLHFSSLISNIESNINKDILEELYYVKKLTQQQIASILGVHKSTVRKYMNLFSIKPRNIIEAQLNGKNNKCTRKPNGQYKEIILSDADIIRAKNIFDNMRSSDFPYYDIKDDKHYIGIIDGLWTFNRGIENKEFPYSRRGIEMCSSLCPQIFSMASKGSLSPLDIFKDDDMLMDCIKRTIKYAKKQTINAVRVGLKTYRNNRCVTIFPPEWAKVAIQYCSGDLKKLSVLDFSCGFGGRLIGSYASGNVTNYVGIDPLNENIISHVKIERLIKKHADLRGNEFKSLFINGTAEDVLGRIDNKFDIIITSPPYFNKENYSVDNTQCYNKFSTYDEWKDKWLKEILLKSCEMLNDNGYIILFISNYGKIPVKDDCSYFLNEIYGHEVEELRFKLPSLEYHRSNIKILPKYDTCLIVQK